MAQMIIRPIQDISVSGVIFSSGSLAYPLINEQTADGDSTFVQWAGTDGGITVRCSVPDISKIKNITSLVVYAVAKNTGMDQASFHFGVSAPRSGGAARSIQGQSAYTPHTYTLSVNASPSSFDLTNVRIYFNPTAMTVKNSIQLTQMYVVINYEEVSAIPFNVRVKVSGTWRTASAIYAKVGGTWRAASKVYAKILGTWRAS